MKRMLLVVLLAVACAELKAQPDVDPRFDSERQHNLLLRIGQDYTLRADAAAREVVVIFGDATIEGRVDGNVVVVLGTAGLSSTASIGDSLIVIGGKAIAASGAQVEDDLVVVGGDFAGDPGFSTGGQHVVIGSAVVGERIASVVPWITRGLLWGRPIVPDLPWVWTVVGVFFLVYLALGLIFDNPVKASVATLADKPLTAFIVGLLVLLLAGPLCFLLAVSIIGLAVVPIVLCAIFAAFLLGKVATARWVGMTIVHQDSLENRLQSFRSFAIGFVVICIAYMVPLLGFVAWGMLGVFGLGGATLAFIAAYRRENPLPIPRERPIIAPHADRSRDVPRESVISSDVDASAVAGPGPESQRSFNAAAGAGFDLLSFPRASFLDRFLAFALDVILVMIAWQFLDLVRRDRGFFFLLLIYHIGFWTWKGTTLGGIICQLRLVRVDGAPLRLVDAFVRGLSGIFSLMVLGIGALWILRDAERQAWHDKIAGTYVVKVPRNWPL